MKWQDRAVLLKIDQLRENSSILTIFTETKGLQKGVIRLTKQNKHSLHIGNIIEVSYSSRLEEHLGKLTILNHTSIFPKIFNNKIKIHLVLSSVSMLSEFLLENDPHSDIFEKIEEFLKNIGSEKYLWYYVHFELNLLKGLGYGLDLQKCAITNQTDSLAFISPKTGKSASFNAGKQFQDKLFKLPQSFINYTNNIKDNLEALKILRFFLEKNLYFPNNLKIDRYRDSLEELIKNQYDN